MEPNQQEPLIDDWLDAALKQRGTAEPRPGLPDRVLARLRSEGSRMPAPAWSWRPAWIALAVTVLIGGALFLARRSESNRQVATATGAPAKPGTLTSLQSRDSQTGAKALPSVHHQQVRVPGHVVETAVVALPKLEQFPSPQPLSEQERLLVRCVQQFPREATLMARAQTELFKQEAIDRQQAGLSVEMSTGLDQQNP
jgi:hypothetical protein